MKDPDKAIFCGKCNIPVTAPSNPAPDSQIVCIECGARDTFEQVWHVCKQSIQYRLKRASGLDVRKHRQKLGLLPIQNAADDTQEPFFKWRIKD